MSFPTKDSTMRAFRRVSKYVANNFGLGLVSLLADRLGHGILHRWW